jgi:hypothetical protein
MEVSFPNPNNLEFESEEWKKEWGEWYTKLSEEEQELAKKEIMHLREDRFAKRMAEALSAPLTKIEAGGVLADAEKSAKRNGTTVDEELENFYKISSRNGTLRPYVEDIRKRQAETSEPETPQPQEVPDEEVAAILKEYEQKIAELSAKPEVQAEPDPGIDTSAHPKEDTRGDTSDINRENDVQQDEDMIPPYKDKVSRDKMSPYQKQIAAYFSKGYIPAERVNTGAFTPDQLHWYQLVLDRRDRILGRNRVNSRNKREREMSTEEREANMRADREAAIRRRQIGKEVDEAAGITPNLLQRDKSDEEIREEKLKELNVRVIGHEVNKLYQRHIAAGATPMEAAAKARAGEEPVTISEPAATSKKKKKSRNKSGRGGATAFSRSILPGILGTAGTLLEGLSRAGGVMNTDDKIPDSGAVIGRALRGAAGNIQRQAMQKDLMSVDSGVAAEANALLQQAGIRNAPDWAKIQIMQSLMRRREEAIRARYHR